MARHVSAAAQSEATKITSLTRVAHHALRACLERLCAKDAASVLFDADHFCVERVMDEVQLLKEWKSLSLRRGRYHAAMALATSVQARVDSLLPAGSWLGLCFFTWWGRVSPERLSGTVIGKALASCRLKTRLSDFVNLVANASDSEKSELEVRLQQMNVSLEPLDRVFGAIAVAARNSDEFKTLADMLEAAVPKPPPVPGAEDRPGEAKQGEAPGELAPVPIATVQHPATDGASNEPPVASKPSDAPREPGPPAGPPALVPPPLVQIDSLVATFEAEQWEDVVRCCSELAAAHEDLRRCAADAKRLQDDVAVQYNLGDQAALDSIHAQLSTVMRTRKTAEEAVGQACTLLETHVIALRSSICAEMGAESTELLAEMLEVVQQARHSFDPAVSERLRCMATETRSEVRRLRSAILATEIRDLIAQMSSLYALGVDVEQTAALLEEQRYLDRSVHDARQRLLNESTLLTTRLREAVLGRRRAGLQEVEIALREPDIAEPQAIECKLLEALGVTDSAQAHDVALRFLYRVRTLSKPLEDRVRTWLRVCSGLKESSADVSLLLFAPTLPSTEGESPAATFEAVSLLTREAAALAPDDDRTRWSFVENLCTPGQREWARALFVSWWGAAPDEADIARWSLLSGLPPSRSQLDTLFAAVGPASRYALASWVAAAENDVASIDEAELIAHWAATQVPWPSFEAAMEAIGARSARDPGAALLMSVVAVLDELETGIQAPWLDVLRSAELRVSTALFTAYQRIGSHELARRVAIRAEARSARDRLDRLTKDKNPNGGPAFEVWVHEVVPALCALEQRLRSPAMRSAALAELRELDPERLLRDALQARELKGINKGARKKLLEWIAAYQELLPTVTDEVDVPAALEGNAGQQMMWEEVEALARASPLATVASQLLPKLFGPRVSTPVERTSYPAEKRQVFEQLLAREVPLLQSWRFALSNAGEWDVEAGKDALERLSGADQVALALDAYVKRKLLTKAERLLAAIPVERRLKHEHAVRTAIEEERRDRCAIVESLLVNPLEDARRAWVFSETGDALDAEAKRLAEDLEYALVDARRLLTEVSASAEDSLIEREISDANELTSQLLNEVALLEVKRRDRLISPLLVALSKVEHGRNQENAQHLAYVFARMLGGDLLNATRAVVTPSSFADATLPAARAIAAEGAVDPVPEVAERHGDPAVADTEEQAGDAEPLLRAAEPTIERLSAITRSEWDAAAVPLGFLVDQGVAAIRSLPYAQRCSRLLQSARHMYATSSPRWPEFMAAWCLEQSARYARDQAYPRAAQFAGDAVAVLAGNDSEDTSLFDEALGFWLAARLEASHLTLAKTPVDWGLLSSRPGIRLISALARKYFELRGVEILAEVFIEAAELGGRVLPRLDTALSSSDHHLRALLIRELVQATPAAAGGLAPLMLLRPWVRGQSAVALRAIVTSGYAGDISVAEALDQVRQLLTSASAPEELIERFQEGLQRGIGGKVVGANDAKRIGCHIVSKHIYLSAAEAGAEGAEIVVEVSSRGGVTNVKDLFVAMTLTHPCLEVDPAMRTQAVGILRPGEIKEFSFPCIPRPGRSTAGPPPRAEGTILLYTEKQEFQQRRSFTVLVGSQYPHRTAQTPYIAGKCLSNLEMIKGRDRDTDEILSKMSGQDSDNFIVLYGMRRIGKSSLLQKLSLDERVRKAYAPVHIDLEDKLKSFDTPATLLAKFAHAIHDDAPDKARDVRVPAFATEAEAYDDFPGYLSAVAASLGKKRRLLLLFDEFQMLFSADRGTLFHDLIKSLRHWIQRLPVAFVVAGTPELREATVGREQRLFQLGVPFLIGPLEETAARELVKDPVKELFTVTGRAADAIVSECARLPNLIQAVCLAMFQTVKSKQKSVATLRDAEDAMAQVAEQPDYFTFLLEPVERNPPLRLVARALADLTRNEKRCTASSLLEHLRLSGYGSEFAADEMATAIQSLSEQELVYNWKGELRLQPPLLARHLHQRSEYEL